MDDREKAAGYYLSRRLRCHHEHTSSTLREEGGQIHHCSINAVDFLRSIGKGTVRA